MRGVAGTDRRPFTVTEVFREPESRRRVLLMFVLSLSLMVGWYAISTWPQAHVQSLATREGLPHPDQ